MSTLLKEYSDTKIKEASIKLVEKIFQLHKKPSEIIISEFVIFLKYGDNAYKGMIPHEKFEIFYSLDSNDEIVIINIADPTLLTEFMNTEITLNA